MLVVFIVERFPEVSEGFLCALRAGMKPADRADVDDFIAPQLSLASLVFLWIAMSAQRILRQKHRVGLELAAQLLRFKMLWWQGAGKLVRLVWMLFLYMLLGSCWVPSKPAVSVEHKLLPAWIKGSKGSERGGEGKSNSKHIRGSGSERLAEKIVLQDNEGGNWIDEGIIFTMRSGQIISTSIFP